MFRYALAFALLGAAVIAGDDDVPTVDPTTVDPATVDPQPDVWAPAADCQMSATEFPSDKLATQSCLMYADLTNWDMRKMAKTCATEEAYYQDDTGVIVWNMCSYIDWGRTPYSASADSLGYSNASSFAFMLQDNNNDETKGHALTSGEVPDELTPLYNDNKDPDGMRYKYTSDTDCHFGFEGEKFSFTNTVMCDTTLTTQGGGQVHKVSGTDSCDVRVKMYHNKGCFDYSALGISKWFANNVWCSTTCLFAVGILCGLFGRKYFPWFMAIFTGMCAGLTVLIFASMVGWLASTAGVIIMCILAIAASGASGYFIKTQMWFMLAFLGLFGGFFFGTFVYSTILAITGWETMALLLLIDIATVFKGAELSAHKPEFLVKGATAFIGAYFFMRGVTFIWGHYPSEMSVFSALANGEDVKVEWQFWVYYLVFIAACYGNYYVQEHHITDTDDALDAYLDEHDRDRKNNKEDADKFNQKA